jgi:hypothetical protein
MTAPPQIIARTLTFKFAQSVSVATGLPDIMEVAVIPLDDASSGVSGATFAGGLKSAQIELSAPVNTVSFDLIPSFSPGLTTPISYRVMWRAGVMGRTFTYDFSMPDQDLDFDQLTSLNLIIDGEAYLQITDLSKPGRVAQLDVNGHVIDSAGNPVATSSDITGLQNNLNVEIVNRQQAVAGARATLEGELASQVAATLNTAEIYTNNQIVAITGDIATERSSRQNADVDLQTQITNNQDTLQTEIDSLVITTGGHSDALDHKADLDNTGHVPVAQIPDEILTNAFPVPDQTAMLALNPNTVHKGSLAVRPDGVFLLTAADPTVLSNWVSLSTISSVNGKRGMVVLSAGDVGAIPVGGAIALNQVTGLATALGTKANQTDLAALGTQVTGILADPTLVHTSAGVVPTALMSSDMVYLNSVGQLVKKDGTIIPITGGGGAVFSVNNKTGLVVLTASDVGAIPTGGSITQAQVTGLSTALGGKADLSGPGTTVPDAQLPNLAMSKITGLSTALTTKADLVGGVLPLSQVPLIPQSSVQNLVAMVNGNQLTTTSNAVNRIGALETAVAGGGGGGGGGTPSTTVFYTSANTTTPVTDFTQINPHSPWGVDSDGTITGTIGTWYYLYTGVRTVDVAYPFITANGHLNLRRWNEAGAADPVFALASDLATLTTTVGTKANQTDLVSLTNTVATKANQTDLTLLSTTVDTKANTADLNATNTAVAGKASASDLSNLTTVVGTKANQSDLLALTTTVGTKAAQSALDANTTAISTINTTLPTKADLVAGVLKSTQIPTNIPQASVTGLVTALSGKADLSGGVLAASQVPTNIPQSSVTGLGAALGNKADLVAGVIPMSQIPLGALPNVAVVANRAALLALTAAQVQVGDLALITATVDKGTYVLTSADPSQFVNWTELTTPDAPVLSVNTKTGTVVLTASDVGALAANASIPIAQITGLQTQLNTFATTSAVNTGLAGKTSPADVQSMFFLSSMVKHADYASNATIASLAGQQSVDGVLVPNGSVVLATAQPSSVNNGLWIVNSGGSWTRPADYATGSFIARDTIVVVTNATGSASGTTNPNTIWQMSALSGFIDSSSTSWTRIGWAAPPFTPAAGNGISITGGSTFAANVQAGQGILATSSGLATDSAVIPRKFIGTVPSGSTVAGVTHNLNTTSPVVSIWDTGSNTLVLAGITAVTANSISIEFNSAPATGQYRVCCIG